MAYINALRQLMQAEGWDAVVISGTDPHGSEYLPKRWQVRKYVSGFTGSAGTVVVTADHAGLWTDSRYFIQATAQLEGTGIELHKLGLPDTVDYPEWMAENLAEIAPYAWMASACRLPLFSRCKRCLHPKLSPS